SDSQGSKRIYLHVFNWPTDGQLVIGGLKSDYSPTALLLPDINNALHGTGAVRDVRGLKVVRINSTDVAIVVPKDAPDPADSVIVLTCNDIQADTNRLLQPVFPRDVLRAFDADTTSGLKFGPGKKTDDTVMGWDQTSESVSWATRLDEPANYDVYANYDAANTSAGGAYRVTLGNQTLDGTVEGGTNQVVKVGHVSLKPGAFTIKVSATKIAGPELFRLRNLELRTTAQ
ncbi:MAG TPA: hypothetical protein VN625_09605, partial [Desulfuromonadaceae bacterium]|nr:hypothetical protein [Desulfuromonadaceae bacterium]